MSRCSSPVARMSRSPRPGLGLAVRENSSARSMRVGAPGPCGRVPPGPPRYPGRPRVRSGSARSRRRGVLITVIIATGSGLAANDRVASMRATASNHRGHRVEADPGFEASDRRGGSSSSQTTTASEPHQEASRRSPAITSNSGSVACATRQASTSRSASFVEDGVDEDHPRCRHGQWFRYPRSRGRTGLNLLRQTRRAFEPLCNCDDRRPDSVPRSDLGRVRSRIGPDSRWCIRPCS